MIYSILNGIGQYLVNTPTHSICCYLVDMHNTTKMQDTRCKHEHGRHINVPCIFLIGKHILYVEFGFETSKLLNWQF